MSIQLPPSGKSGSAPDSQPGLTSGETSPGRLQQALQRLIGRESRARVINVQRQTANGSLDVGGSLRNQQQTTQLQVQARLEQTTHNTMTTLLRLNAPVNNQTAPTMPYQATLQIGQLRFSVASPVALQSGDELLLKILSSHEFALLKLPAAQQQQTTDSTLMALQNALRSLLPKLHDQSRLLTLLQQLRPAQLQSLPIPSQEALSSLQQASLPLASLSQTPTSATEQTLMANTIRQALLASGIFQRADSATALTKFAKPSTQLAQAASVGSSAADSISAKIPEIIRQSIASWFQGKNAHGAATGQVDAALARAAAKHPGNLLKSGDTSATQTSQATLNSADSLKSATQQLSQQLLTELLAIGLGQRTSQTELAKFPGDLSAQLRRAAELLRQQNTPTSAGKETARLPVAQREQALLMLTLLRESLATLVRTQLHQLTSLNMQQQTADTQQHNHWFTELPIQLGEQTQHVQIQLEEESSQQQYAGQRQWKVMLRFELERLGLLFVRLILVGDSVKTTLWAESGASQRFIRKQLDDLAQRLQKVGVNVEQLECLCGIPADPRMQVQQSLIDIKT